MLTTSELLTSVSELKKELDFVRRLAYIRRYAGGRVQQSVLEHTGSGQFFVLAYAKAKNWDDATLGRAMRKFQLHDVDEVITNDIPYPAKRVMEGVLGNAAQQVCEEACRDMYFFKPEAVGVLGAEKAVRASSVLLFHEQVAVALEYEITICVAFCDMLELVDFCWRELMFYNNMDSLIIECFNVGKAACVHLATMRQGDVPEIMTNLLSEVYNVG